MRWQWLVRLSGASLSNLIFAVRRALFAQPLGMTANMVRRKVARLFGGAAPAATAPAPPHPIDVRYGIDTGGIVPASALRTGNATADLYNFGYAGSQPSIVRAALATIPDLASWAFVDIGSGKGRVLAVASEYPFRSILGVELSPELTEIAAANAARIAALHPERTPIATIAADALGIDLPAGRTIVYIYNSLYAALLKRLADRIAAHAALPGNHIMLIYYNPASARVFDEHSAFSRYHAAAHLCEADEAASTSWGTPRDSVVIWQATAGTALPPQSGANATVAVVAGGAAGEVIEPASASL